MPLLEAHPCLVHLVPHHPGLDGPTMTRGVRPHIWGEASHLPATQDRHPPGGPVNKSIANPARMAQKDPAASTTTRPAPKHPQGRVSQPVNSADRSRLPFRERCEVFLLDLMHVCPCAVYLKQSVLIFSCKRKSHDQLFIRRHKYMLRNYLRLGSSQESMPLHRTRSPAKSKGRNSLSELLVFCCLQNRKVEGRKQNGILRGFA